MRAAQRLQRRSCAPPALARGLRRPQRCSFAATASENGLRQINPAALFRTFAARRVTSASMTGSWMPAQKGLRPSAFHIKKQRSRKAVIAAFVCQDPL